MAFPEPSKQPEDSLRRAAVKKVCQIISKLFGFGVSRSFKNRRLAVREWSWTEGRRGLLQGRNGSSLEKEVIRLDMLGTV